MQQRVSRLPARNFIITSTDPESGVWSDPVPVAFHGMDPSLFFDDDGKTYYQGAMFPEDPSKGMKATISQAEIDVSTGTLLSELRPIWQGCSGGAWPEGPHLYKRDKWYYALLAEGGTHKEHCITVARSGSPWGPFESYSKNPVLSNRGTGEYIQGVGHAALFQDESGRWWAVTLGIRVQDESFPLCRETFLCPVDWTEDGWPCFNSGKSLTTEMCVDRTPPSNASKTTESTSLTSFSFRQHLPELLYLRNPNFETCQWNDNGTLTLIGENTTLDSECGTSTLVAVRQRHLEAEFSAKVAIAPTAETYESGITVYFDNYRHLDLFISTNLASQKRELKLRTVSLKCPLEVQNKLGVRTVESTYLGVTSSEMEYIFRYRDEGETPWREIGRVASAEISEWGFTGMLIS